MFMLPTSLLCLISASSVLALPMRALERDINIVHTSPKTGMSTTHSIDPMSLDPALAAAIMSSNININLLSDRARRHVEARMVKRSGIANSTINLTVIGGAAKRQLDNSTLSDSIPSDNSSSTALPLSPSHSSEPTHHNIYVDASTSGNSTGGIRNSTINVNLVSRSEVGSHSVLVDSSSSPSTSDNSGIDASIVHINILPGRSPKSIGSSSILIDSSASSDAVDAPTTAGDHSAIVDTSSTTSTPSKGVNGSTINVTVVDPVKVVKRDQTVMNNRERASAAVTARVNDEMKKRALGLNENVRFVLAVRRSKEQAPVVVQKAVDV